MEIVKAMQPVFGGFMTFNAHRAAGFRQQNIIVVEVFNRAIVNDSHGIKVFSGMKWVFPLIVKMIAAI